MTRTPLLALVLLVALGLPAPASAQNPPVTVNVDATLNQRPINPLVYGVAHASQATLSDLNCPLNRSGGNPTTRYNWQVNADNRGSDWYFQSVPSGSAVAGQAGDSFITASRAAGAEPMLTVPLIGWVARLGANRTKLASFSIAKYGPQTDNDWQWFPDAGNGIRPGGAFVTGNDKTDASVLVDSQFQKGWVQHLVNRWGPASAGGLRYYILDNEPSIWHATHRDVHPTGVNMDQIRDKILDYAARIKEVDPTALVAGPEEWGWTAYLYSGYDQWWAATHGWGNLPDRNAHGGWDYLPWLLDQLRQRDASTGQRLLDVFTVHYYPQGGEFSETVSSSMQLRRNRSTRSLWDPNYVDETWINDTVRLVPRLRDWVGTYYPGTQIGITEYNWGAEGHINGATTQADVFGIFGREGLDVGARWTTPDAATPTYKAMKMYRNYDGNRSTFGDVSVAASGPNPDQVSTFAALRSSDGALTVMVVSKVLSGTTPATLNLAHFTPGPLAQAWQLTSANAITRLPDVAVAGGALSATLPPQSVTLFVVPRVNSALSVGDVSLAEGHEGTSTATFTVTLSPASAQTVTVAFATTNGTATAGSDYVAAGGTLTFPAGTTSRSVPVTILGDRTNEPDETFQVVLSNPSNATLADGQGQGTIANDDPGGLTIADAAIAEGRLLPVNATFRVTLAPVSASTVTVNYAAAAGTATAGVDFTAATGQLTFAPGVGVQTIPVPVLPDSQVEGVETFSVTLSGAVNASIAFGTATGRILDAAGGADFNGDNRTDLVWRHDVSGQNVFWFMNGVVLVSGAFTNPQTLPDTRWKIVGTNDFNADGRADILWRHANSGENVVWMMNGVNLLGGSFTTPAALSDVRWKMVGTGDFNLDGRPDILWRHDFSGENVLWYMNGTVLATGTFTTPASLTDVRWKMAGVGDFNRDGKPDVLWHHTTSGQLVLWYMDGAVMTSGVFTTPNGLADVNWRVVAVGDYNGDERPDVVWRHQVSGQNVAWFMNDATLISGTFTNPSSLADTNWKLVGPR